MGTQVQPQIILDPDYLTDYLSTPYDYGFNEYLAQLFSFSRALPLRLIWTLNWYFKFFSVRRSVDIKTFTICWLLFSFSCLFHSFDFRTILFNECYVSVSILLCFDQKNVNERWKRIRNHLKVVVSFYKKCIVPYKNHNAQNRPKDNLNKGILEFWKTSFSIYFIPQKNWDKSEEFFQKGGKFESDFEDTQAFFGQKWQN